MSEFMELIESESDYFDPIAELQRLDEELLAELEYLVERCGVELDLNEKVS